MENIMGNTMEINKRQNRLFRLILCLIFLAADIAFVFFILSTRLVPVRYVGIMILGLLIMLSFVYLLIQKFRRRILFFTGVVFMTVCILAEGVFSFYIYKTMNALNEIAGTNKEVSQFYIYIRNDSEAETLADIVDKSWGIMKELDRQNTDQVLRQLFYETGKEIEVKEYGSLTDLAEGLIKGECQAIILNSAYLEVMEEMDAGQTFLKQVRVLCTQETETVIQRNESLKKSRDQISAQMQKQEDIYTIYISGIDTRGEITASSLSDVNIILTVNTKTHQVLMISTPRDYYVPLSISDGKEDKLTHAGIYGINVCIDTMKMLYNIDINYYFRINFGGFVRIIDALKGITVESDYEFETKNMKGYSLKKGANQVDGMAALAFCRERYSFAEGDRQRGRNQMAVIRGVAQKMMSEEFLKNYLSILDGAEGCFETNIPYTVVSDMIQTQIRDKTTWEFWSYSVDGTGDMQEPYSMKQKAYVMIPDMETVERAKYLMVKVREGERLSETDVARFDG